MKNLLYKEWKLCMNPQAYIFMFFGFFALIPDYPLFIIPVFFLSSIPTIVAFAKEANDIFYTATLPIKRNDVPKSKIIFFASIELAFILISGVFIFISYLLMKYQIIPNGDGTFYTKNSTGMNPNITVFGIYLITFGLFNLIFCPLWYRKPEKFALAYFTALFISMIGACILGTLPLIFTDVDKYFNLLTNDNWYFQLIFLVISIGIFILLNYLAIILSRKKFKKLDI